MYTTTSEQGFQPDAQYQPCKYLDNDPPTDDVVQPAQYDWLVGDLKRQAPKVLQASWVGHPNRPHLAEYVPPNPPQPLGAGIDKMLEWPTYRRQHTSTNDSDKSSLMQFPFFRQQVLKHNEKVTQEERPFGYQTPSKSRNPLVATVMGGLSSGQQALRPSAGHSWSHNRQAHSVSNTVMHSGSLRAGVLLTGHNTDIPEKLLKQLPKLLRPSNPEQLRNTLNLLQPLIVFSVFECADACRSIGICVHFSFVLGPCNAPDGLICPKCHKAGKEKAVVATRPCPRHDGYVFLAEDVMATEAQSLRANEILARSLNGVWEGVPSRPNRTSKTKADASDLTLGSRAIGPDAVMPSIEAARDDGEPPAKRVRFEYQHEESEQNDHVNRGSLDGMQRLTGSEIPFDMDDMFSAELTAFMENSGEIS